MRIRARFSGVSGIGSGHSRFPHSDFFFFAIGSSYHRPRCCSRIYLLRNELLCHPDPALVLPDRQIPIAQPFPDHQLHHEDHLEFRVESFLWL